MARKAIPKEAAETPVPVKAAVKRGARRKTDAAPAADAPVKPASAGTSAPATKTAATRAAGGNKPAAVSTPARTGAASSPQASDKPAKPAKAARPSKAVKPAKPGKAAQAAAKLERKLAAGKGKGKAAKAAPASRPSADGQDKPRLVRDSFTMPEQEYAVLAQVKQACLKAGIEVKKSELLRIGVALISQLDLATLGSVLTSLPQLKTGRPRGR